MPTKDEFIERLRPLSCIICLEEYSSEHVPVELPCGHVFGDFCIVKQTEAKVLNNNRCPLCREVLFEQDDFDEDGNPRFDVSDSEEEEEEVEADEEEEDDVVEQTQEEYEAQLRISVEDNRSTVSTDGDEVSTVGCESLGSRVADRAPRSASRHRPQARLPRASARRVARMSAPSAPRQRRTVPPRRSEGSYATRRSVREFERASAESRARRTEKRRRRERLRQPESRPWDESSSSEQFSASSAESEYEPDDDDSDAEDEREEKRVYKLLPGEAPIPKRKLRSE